MFKVHTPKIIILFSLFLLSTLACSQQENQTAQKASHNAQIAENKTVPQPAQEQAKATEQAAKATDEKSSDGPAPAASAPQATEPQYTLMFFMNPNGRPCQIQDQLLMQASEAIGQKATIQYIKTTVPNDRALFYDFGIRSLPAIVIVDKNGTVVTRFPPGIQQPEVILSNM